MKNGIGYITFGQKLRSARLKFFWSDKHRAFIRISEQPENKFLVEVCSPTGLFDSRIAERGRKQKQDYFIWPDSPEILDEIERLQYVFEPEGYQSFFIGDTGV